MIVLCWPIAICEVGDLRQIKLLILGHTHDESSTERGAEDSTCIHVGGEEGIFMETDDEI